MQAFLILKVLRRYNGGSEYNDLLDIVTKRYTAGLDGESSKAEWEKAEQDAIDYVSKLRKVRCVLQVEGTDVKGRESGISETNQVGNIASISFTTERVGIMPYQGETAGIDLQIYKDFCDANQKSPYKYLSYLRLDREKNSGELHFNVMNKDKLSYSNLVFERQ
jgi:hypothetical protein